MLIDRDVSRIMLYMAGERAHIVSRIMLLLWLVLVEWGSRGVAHRSDDSLSPALDHLLFMPDNPAAAVWRERPALSFRWHPLSIRIEAPTKERGGCSRMTTPPPPSEERPAGAPMSPKGNRCEKRGGTRREERGEEKREGRGEEKREERGEEKREERGERRGEERGGRR